MIHAAAGDASCEPVALVQVPLDGSLPAQVVVTAAWTTPQPPEALARAEEGLRALARLVQRPAAADLERRTRGLQTERFLEQLFDALPIGVGVADPGTGEMLSVNGAFATLVGYEPDEMVGALPPHRWWPEAPC